LLNSPGNQEFAEACPFTEFIEYIEDKDVAAFTERLQNNELPPYPEYDKISRHLSVDFVEKYACFRTFPMMIE